MLVLQKIGFDYVSGAVMHAKSIFDCCIPAKLVLLNYKPKAEHPSLRMLVLNMLVSMTLAKDQGEKALFVFEKHSIAISS